MAEHTPGQGRHKTRVSMGKHGSTSRSTGGLAAAAAGVHTQTKGKSPIGRPTGKQSVRELTQYKARPEVISDGNGISTSRKASAATLKKTLPRMPSLMTEATAGGKCSASRVAASVSITTGGKCSASKVAASVSKFVFADPSPDGKKRTTASTASTFRSSARKCDKKNREHGDQGGSSLWQHLRAGNTKGVHSSKSLVGKGDPAKPDCRGKLCQHLATAHTKLMASKYGNDEKAVRTDVSKARRPLKYRDECEGNVKTALPPSTRKPVARIKRILEKMKNRDQEGAVHGVTKSRKRKLTLLRNMPKISGPSLPTMFGLKR